ncbi:phage tail tape measure protein [Mycobacterium sp. KBS0706]|uniref:phage tail tape measure protein n=1 Tax=Mycobacterium sp. KBS0706 TaxID=2578109 RepID=UPI001C8F54A3|nr:hypothetical protein [Mycobacterium sp. KBS0706]
MTDMRVALRIEGDSSSAKAALADTRQGIDQVKASAAGAGPASASIVAIGTAAGAAGARVSALGAAEQAAATAAAAMGQSNATAAEQVQQSGAAAAAAASAIEASVEAQTLAVNDNTRALTEATAAMRAFLAAQGGAGGSLPGTVPPLSAQARALRDIVEAADPAARQTRLLAEAQDVLKNAVQEGTITQQRGAEVLQRYEQTLQAGGNRMGGFGAVAQQAGYQIGDFAVQVSSGQSALVAFAQQGTQVLGIFGVWGAVAGAALAIAAGLANGFGLFEDATVSSDEAVQIHEENLKKWTSTGELAKQKADQLAYSFIGMSGAAREAAALEFQDKIKGQLGAIDQAAKQAIDELGKVGVAFDKARSLPDGEFGLARIEPARVRVQLDVEIPPDLDAKVQALLKPLFEGNRDRTFLSDLHRDLQSIAQETDGEARKAIEGIASSVSRLSRDTQTGSQEIRLLEALMRSARGTADELDRDVIDAAVAMGQLGTAVGRSADMVDRLIGSIDRYLNMPIARTIVDQAEGFGSQFLQTFNRMQAESDIRRGIDNTRADAAAIGNETAERARARQRAVDQARERAAQAAIQGQVINAQPLIDDAGVAAGEKFDREQDKLAAKAAVRAAKQKNDYGREIERIQKATDETETQADAIGLTSRASAELTVKQQLLYAAQTAGLKVSEQMRAEIDKTAAAYAEQGERLRQLQIEERKRQQLTSEAISLIGATATPDEELSRQYRQLAQMQTALQSMDPGVLERLAEAGYTAADAQEAIQRQLQRLNNPELFGFADDAKSALGDLARSITTDFSTAGDALMTFGNRLADLAAEKFIIDPLIDRAGQWADGLMGNLLGGDSDVTAGQQASRGGLGGLLDDLLGTGPANDNSNLAQADFAVATATINVAGGAIAGGLAAGLLPDRPDATLDKLAGSLAGDKLQGGAGTDVLGGAVDQVGDALNDVAEGVRQEGSGFLGSFGGALGSLVNGFGSLLSGDVGGGLSGILNGLLSVAAPFLGFSKGAAFVGGTVRAFASGTVVNGPTYFPMADGQMGLMGEAGPEAIMPLIAGAKGLAVRAANANGSVVPLHLTRLQDGSLGVALPPAVPHARGGVFDFAMPTPPPASFSSGMRTTDQDVGVRGQNGSQVKAEIHLHGVSDFDGFRRSRGQVMSSFGAEMLRAIRRNGGNG